MELGDRPPDDGALVFAYTEVLKEDMQTQVLS